MLKRPMSESDHAPTAGGSPHSATTPGRCVAMKATWKPQTKKPAVRSRKLGSFQASRTAALMVFSTAATPGACSCLPRRTQASGTMASFSGGTARATADISTPSPAMPPPPAATTPIRSTSIQVLVAWGVSTVPIMTSTAPAAMTRPVPYLSAAAPAIGCVMPHMSCAQANARLIAAMPRPVAELSEPMKSATDWRTPKMSANTSPAATMIQICLRVIALSLYNAHHIQCRKKLQPAASRSARELEALEAVQCFFDSPLAQPARAIADPAPSLHQQFLPLAIGLEINDGDDFVPDEHGLGEVAEQPLVLGNVSLEAVLVVEEQMQPLALMDERVEGRQDVDVLMRGIEGGIERLGPRPVLQGSGSFELDGDQLLAAQSDLDQSPHDRLARGV